MVRKRGLKRECTRDDRSRIALFESAATRRRSEGAGVFFTSGEHRRSGRKVPGRRMLLFWQRCAGGHAEGGGVFTGGSSFARAARDGFARYPLQAFTPV